MRKFLSKVFGDKIDPVFILIAAVASFLILAIFFRLMERPAKAVCNYILREDDLQEQRKERVVQVEAEVVKKGVMNKRIISIGKLRANESVTIKSEMNGRIKEIAFEQGTRVEKDDLLIQFEDSDIKARLSQAQAELKVRQADFDRIKKLFDQKVESQKKFDEASGGLSMAEAKVEEATAALEKTVIKAPFSGNVGITEFSNGAYVQAGAELVNLVDETPIKADFKVPERYVNDVGVGQSLEVNVDAFPDRSFEGVLEAVDSKIDSESHSLKLRGAIPNENGVLKPGLFASVNLVIGEQGDVIKISESAVERMADKEYIYYIDKGRARQAQIITGHREDGQVEVKAGLTPGQLVVIAGQIKLGNGMRVKITNMDVSVDNQIVENNDKASPTTESEKAE